MLRGNLCLVADVLFQSDFLNWRSAHVEASDKGPERPFTVGKPENGDDERHMEFC